LTKFRIKEPLIRGYFKNLKEPAVFIKGTDKKLTIFMVSCLIFFQFLRTMVVNQNQVF